MKIVLYSDDISILSHLEESLKGYEYEIAQNIEELSLHGNTMFILHNISQIGNINKTSNKIFVIDRVPTFERGEILLDHGVVGYANALISPLHLRSAIESIKDGYVWLYPEFSSHLIRQMNSKKSSNDESADFLKLLSKREKEIALMIKSAKLNKEIALELNISMNTLKIHIKNIYKKLHVSDKFALIALFH